MVSQHSLMQYLNFRDVFCHNWLNRHRSSRDTGSTTWPGAFSRNGNTRGGSTFPTSLNTHPFSHARNIQWVPQRLWKCCLMWAGSALVSRRDPHPLLKPGTVFAIDFFCQGCSVCVVSAQSVSWASKPGCAPGLILSKPAHSFCCCNLWGAAFMETITWVTQENGNRLLQLPSCSRAVDGLKARVCRAPTDISKSREAHGLPVAAGGLKTLHHELQSSLHAGKPAAVPGQASSGVGRSQTTTGNWTCAPSHR